MICGFIAFDAPARVRVRWQLLGRRSSASRRRSGCSRARTPATAVLAMAAVACAGGFLVAVSLRLAVAGLTITLALVISQGVLVDPADAGAAFAYGLAGGVAQAAMAALAWLVADRAREPGRLGRSCAPESRSCAAPRTATAPRFVTRCASAPRWRSGSRSTGSPGSPTTATGCR